ncbi:MAG: xanthine dehydrogenase family protein subunit M [Christensenellaceae bacterium]|nr:xanthine dehydrogenase family protein subunit M [Christensenellaceae bacterium]
MIEPFVYYTPAAVAEAVQLLGQRSAKLIAGGTDVLVQMQEGLLSPEALVDISGIDALKGIREETEHVVIGAAATHHEVMEWAHNLPQYAALAEASGSVGTPQVRNIATVAGNLCNAVPSADLGAPVLLYNSSLTLASANGSRQLPAIEFFTGPKKTALLPGEMVLSIRLTAPPVGCASAYCKHGPRKASDLAMVGVAAMVGLDDNSAVTSLVIGLNAVAPTPILVQGCEQLVGQVMSLSLLDRCARMAAQQCRPITDYRAGAEYRRDMVGVLTKRALERCAAKLGKEVREDG